MRLVSLCSYRLAHLLLLGGALSVLVSCTGADETSAQRMGASKPAVGGFKPDGMAQPLGVNTDVMDADVRDAVARLKTMRIEIDALTAKLEKALETPPPPPMSAAQPLPLPDQAMAAQSSIVAGQMQQAGQATPVGTLPPMPPMPEDALMQPNTPSVPAPPMSGDRPAMIAPTGPAQPTPATAMQAPQPLQPAPTAQPAPVVMAGQQPQASQQVPPPAAPTSQAMADMAAQSAMIPPTPAPEPKRLPIARPILDNDGPAPKAKTAATTPAPKTEASAKTDTPAAVTGSGVVGVRVGDHGDKVRLVLDVAGTSNFAANLDNKEKILTVELETVGWSAEKQKTFAGSGLIQSFTAQDSGKGSVGAFVLSKESEIVSSTTLKGADGKPARIVIDLKK